MRQTNVIWVAFTAALYGYKLLTEALDQEKLQIHKEVIHKRFCGNRFKIKQNEIFSK
jgi:hypothetical protein